MNAIHVSVYKCPLGDFTLGGISGRHDRLLLWGSIIDGGISDTDEVVPAIYLCEQKNRHRVGQPLLYCRPMDVPESVQLSFGGNFVFSSDGRFPLSYPIPVHDRREG